MDHQKHLMARTWMRTALVAGCAVFATVIPLWVMGLDAPVESAGQTAMPMRGASQQLAGDEVPEGLSTSAWTTIQKQMRRAQYDIAPVKTDEEGTPAYRAVNASQGLVAHFGERGMVVSPRSRDGGWEWGLTLTAWGREGAVSKPRTPQMVAEGNRIEYRRGLMTEWYINDLRCQALEP